MPSRANRRRGASKVEWSATSEPDSATVTKAGKITTDPTPVVAAGKVATPVRTATEVSKSKKGGKVAARVQAANAAEREKKETKSSAMTLPSQETVEPPGWKAEAMKAHRFAEDSTDAAKKAPDESSVNFHKAWAKLMWELA